MKMNKKLFSLLLVFTLMLAGCSATQVKEDITNTTNIHTENESIENESTENKSTTNNSNSNTDVINLDDIPDYKGIPYVEINGNVPFFTDEDKKRTDAFETYSDLDNLGRCGVAYANICKELQPTDERGAIGQVKPSGWKTMKYNGYVEGNYLYNRCHLIGFQLAGENANEKNLITGTRYMNCDGQLPFEDIVDDYVDSTKNHVLYRVTPIFENDNLVASGVLTEAYSVEDSGKGVQFCVYCYNVQPGIGIDYTTGDSWLIDGYKGEYSTETYFRTHTVKDYSNGQDISYAKNNSDNNNPDNNSKETTYILNENTHKFHIASCKYVKDMSDSNKSEVTESREKLISDGYEPCKVCNP